MPRAPVEDNNRMSLRIPPYEKAMLLRAAALKHKGLSEFVREQSVDAAKAIIREEEHISLSQRDSQRILDLLENPSKPNAKLVSAAKALPKRK